MLTIPLLVTCITVMVNAVGASPVFSNGGRAYAAVNFGQGINRGVANPAVYRQTLQIAPVGVAVAPAVAATVAPSDTITYRRPATHKPFANFAANAHQARSLEEQREASKSFQYDNKHNTEADSTRTVHGRDQSDDVYTHTFRRGLEWGNQEGAIYPVNSMGDIYYPSIGFFGPGEAPLRGYGVFSK
ncbi:PREDICTED: uncharacterized protein LOC106806581 [Priapulus caudatus]|uniref:Uncharacterized protein LOC106806581 n=1 Tax=Priapulus caudatus TaxID=37621 RepID=A0ABM1DVT8_PRICU|nr:PREDICTED: uncharacterized protein LOC106806581 [Priapulus caudatus]